jgi:hypothetical protein
MNAPLAASRRAKAEFVLAEAHRLGFKIGTDGENIDFITPRGMPRETAMSFSRAIYDLREEIIVAIQTQARKAGETEPDNG